MNYKQFYTFSALTIVMCLLNFYALKANITPPKNEEEGSGGHGALSLTSPTSWTYENGILNISSRFEELQTVVINGIEHSVSGYECQIEIMLSEGEYPITILTESHSYDGTLCVD